jgi:hypothetical protein
MTIEEIVEAGGAKFVERVGDSVRFCDPNDGRTFTLYLLAVSVDNVRLTLKHHREDLTDPWWQSAREIA